VAIAAASAACATVGTGGGGEVVTETWIVDAFRSANVDSVAIWHPDAWLIATAKEADALLVFSAADGTLLREVTLAGTRLGGLDRPNGIRVVDDLALVVERNHRRVTVLRLPDFEPVGTFGDDVLRWPYGLAIVPEQAGRYTVYVTDNYETESGGIPTPAALGERVRVFSVGVDRGVLDARLVDTFGDTAGPGVLHKVESIAADPERGRLLIADELEAERNIKIYDMQGRYTGRSIGGERFRVEVEGIDLYECGDRGYWVATDQSDRISWFRIFERGSLDYVGTVVGERTHTTDGIVVTSTPIASFGEGGLFAAHGDAGLAAMDWRNIREALGLPLCSNS
jgi:3-phytase